MTPDALRDLCLSLPQAIETFPFDPDVSVFKTSGNDKMFAASRLRDLPLRVSLKVDPEESLALQAAHPQITPGYHMNKRHWITVLLDGSVPGGVPGGVPDDLLEELVRGSYALVAPRVRRASGTSSVG
jgi:predicted DNA-binding protein (MmcQ/YjbR family)